MSFLNTKITTGKVLLSVIESCADEIDSAKVSVSFYGRRFVQIGDTSISLNRFSRLVESAGWEINEFTGQFSKRAAGMKIVTKLNDLYKESDQLLNKRNWLYRLIGKCTAFFSGSASIRANMEENVEKVYRRVGFAVPNSFQWEALQKAGISEKYLEEGRTVLVENDLPRPIVYSYLKKEVIRERENS